MRPPRLPTSKTGDLRVIPPTFQKRDAHMLPYFVRFHEEIPRSHPALSVFASSFLLGPSPFPGVSLWLRFTVGLLAPSSLRETISIPYITRLFRDPA